MKKLLYSLLAIFFITGCTNSQKVNYPNSNANKETMYIKPTEFSEETMEVLDLFDEEIQFFDISINDTAKSHTVSIWVYRDGEWKEDGKSYGEMEFLGNRYAIRLTETSCELYSIDENGHTKVTYPKLDTTFDESTAKMGWRLSNETEIELNQEIPLWVMIGSNVNSFEVSNMEKNFREINCSAGIAITLTVSDKVVE